MKEQFAKLIAQMKDATGKDHSRIALTIMTLHVELQKEEVPIPSDIFDGLDDETRRLVLQAFLAFTAQLIQT